MHTDEYEISLAREIEVCQRFVRRIADQLERNRQQYGMDYLQASAAVEEGRLGIRPKELAAWRDDFEALPQWQQRLEEYKNALAIMRVSSRRN